MEKPNVDFLLKTPLSELITFADRVRKETVGPGLELCSIINAKSGLCSEDCKFCAQSSHHKAETAVYPLKDKDRIIEAARQAKENGAESFGIVTSGNRLSAEELKIIVEAVGQIKDKVKIDICASLGALEKTELTMLKQAGLSRYHHNIETSRRYYRQIVSTHSFEERVNTIKAAKSVGLDVCSGGIIGMGETWQDRIDMASVLRDLKVDSVPVNFLVPVQGTPFESLPLISCVDAVRTICIFRIILPGKTIKIAAGRESILKDFQAMAMMAGANGMLIGGYLTIKGRDLAQDHRFVKEIEKLWTA